MFCSFCGATLHDDAKFCFNCGAKAGSFDLSRFTSNASQIKFVPAKCTNCGASLRVDPTQKVATCPYCDSTYVVEQAIQQYNISVEGNVTVNGATININDRNVNNLLERAEEFARQGNFDKGLQYFDEVLDIDINSIAAKKGIQKIKKVLNDYVFMSEVTSSGKLELKKGRLIFTNSIGPQLYELTKIFSLDIVKRGIFSSGKTLQFIYSGIPQKRVNIETENPNQWFTAIEDAKMGKYPKMTNLGEYYAKIILN